MADGFYVLLKHDLMILTCLSSHCSQVMKNQLIERGCFKARSLGLCLKKIWRASSNHNKDIYILYYIYIIYIYILPCLAERERDFGKAEMNRIKDLRDMGFKIQDSLKNNWESAQSCRKDDGINISFILREKSAHN